MVDFSWKYKYQKAEPAIAVQRCIKNVASSHFLLVYSLLEVGTQYLATFGFFFWGTISFCDTTAASIETKGDGVDNKYQTNDVPVHVDVGIAFPGRSTLTN